MHWTIYVELIVVALIVLIIILLCYEFRKLAVAKTTPLRISGKAIACLVRELFFSLAIPFWAIYYQAVKLILWIKHGNKFGGLLKGPDVAFVIDNGRLYHLLCIIQFDAKDNTQKFYEVAEKTIREAFKTKFTEDPKICATIHKSLGYYYLLTKELTFEDCFKTMKTVDSSTGEITKADLEKLIGEYSDVPLARDNTNLWEISVGTQPVRWTEKDQSDLKKCYPLIVKVNHSLADAVHLFKSIIGTFADDKLVEISHTSGVPSQVGNVKRNLLHRVLTKFKLAYLLLMSLPVVMLNMLLMIKDANDLHGPPLINQKILGFSAEESPHYIETVKRIKQKFPGCSFEDVFLAAFTASLGDFFKKRSTSIPEYLTTEMPIVPEAVRLLSQTVHEIKAQPISCQNALSVHVRKLPVAIACGGTKQNLINTLEFIKRERALLAKCVEKEVNYVLLTILMKIVPERIMRISLNSSPTTDLAISNIIGPVKFTVADRCQVKDLVVFTGHRIDTGVAVVIFSYDNRIKLSLAVDKAIINKREEVQDILTGVFKYIDLLDNDPKAII